MMKINLRSKIGSKQTIKTPLNPNEIVDDNCGQQLIHVLPKTCVVCTKCKSRYECPRCNISYCSSDCYKVHGETCTEGFYKFHVSRHLKIEEQIQKEDAVSQKKMLEMLQRSGMRSAGEEIEHETSQTPFSELGLSEETLYKVAMVLGGGGQNNDVELMDLLSPGELKAFEKAVARGQVTQLISPWVPFWDAREAPHPGISEIPSESGFDQALNATEANEDDAPDSDDEAEPGAVEQAPEIEEKIRNWPHTVTLEICGLHSVKGIQNRMGNMPSIKSLRSTPTSPLLRFMTLDLLLAGAFTLRLFNGCWCGENLVEAASVLLQVSPVLSQNTIYNSTLEAVETSLQNITSQKVQADILDSPFSPAQHLLLLDDLKQILSQKLFVTTTLANNFILLEEALKTMGDADEEKTHYSGRKNTRKPKRKGKSSKKQSHSKSFFKAKGKSKFYMGWVHSLVDKQILDELICDLLEYKQVKQLEPPST